jgi:hypothetical protein
MDFVQNQQLLILVSFDHSKLKQSKLKPSRIFILFY